MLICAWLEAHRDRRVPMVVYLNFGANIAGLVFQTGSLFSAGIIMKQAFQASSLNVTSTYVNVVYRTSMKVCMNEIDGQVLMEALHNASRVD